VSEFGDFLVCDFNNFEGKGTGAIVVFFFFAVVLAGGALES